MPTLPRSHRLATGLALVSTLAAAAATPAGATSAERPPERRGHIQVRPVPLDMALRSGLEVRITDASPRTRLVTGLLHTVDGTMLAAHGYAHVPRSGDATTKIHFGDGGRELVGDRRRIKLRVGSLGVHTTVTLTRRG